MPTSQRASNRSTGSPSRPMLRRMGTRKAVKKKEVDVSAGGESPPAVREVLLMRQKTLGAIDISKVTPGGLNAPLTDRRFEMSRILAEELLRMFIRRKRQAWLENPHLHPSNQAAAAAPPPKGGKAATATPAAAKGGKGAKPPAKPAGGKGGGKPKGGKGGLEA